MRASRRPSRGFTLMEVMLALAIFGIVTTMLYGTFARTLRSKALAEQRAEVTRLGRAAIGRMADEIGSAYCPANTQGAAFFRVLKAGTETAPLDALQFTALSTRPAGLDGRGTDQRTLMYYFPRDRSGLRREGKTKQADRAATDSALDRPANRGGSDYLSDDADDFFAAFGPAHPPVLGTSPQRLLRREAITIRPGALDDARTTTFLDDVASLEFTFYDGHEWRDLWDSVDPNSRRLPRAVRIDLALYDEAGEIHHFTTAVDLPLSDTPLVPLGGSPGAKSPTPARSPGLGARP